MGHTLRSILSIAAPIAGTLLFPGLGTALGLGAGGLGIGAEGLSAIGGGLGGATGGALSGGGVKGALEGGALGAAGGYLGSGGASDLIGGTQLGNTLGLTNPGEGSLIGNAIGSTPGVSGPGVFSNLLGGTGVGNALGLDAPTGGSTFGNLLGSDSSDLAPSVTGGTANSAPLSGGGSSTAVPSNTLASPTLSSSGGGVSSYNPMGGAATPDISTADPSLTSKLPWQTGSGIGGSTSGFNYDINGNAAGVSSYGAPTQLSNATVSAISPGNAVTAGEAKVGSGLSMLGSLLGGASSLYSNNQAQNALVSGQNKALSVLQPYLNSGGAANSQLSDLLGTSGNTGATGYGTLGQPFNPGDLTQTPGYNFALDQGNQELDRQNAARGGYFSGGAIKAGQNFAQNLASTTYQQQLQDYMGQQQQQYGMLAGQAGAGANAANTAGTIFGNNGAAKANADTANNQVLGSTLGSLLGSGKTPINIGGQIVYV